MLRFTPDSAPPRLTAETESRLRPLVKSSLAARPAAQDPILQQALHSTLAIFRIPKQIQWFSGSGLEALSPCFATVFFCKWAKSSSEPVLPSCTKFRREERRRWKMWTVEDRERYKEAGRRYASDRTDSGWELVRSL